MRPPVLESLALLRTSRTGERPFAPTVPHLFLSPVRPIQTGCGLPLGRRRPSRPTATARRAERPTRARAFPCSFPDTSAGGRQPQGAPWQPGRSPPLDDWRQENLELARLWWIGSSNGPRLAQSPDFLSAHFELPHENFLAVFAEQRRRAPDLARRPAEFDWDAAYVRPPNAGMIKLRDHVSRHNLRLAQDLFDRPY